MNDLGFYTFLSALIFLILGSFFMVLFGQISVRKLRKNPETKDSLGLSFLSGWEILNVAETLSLPRTWVRKLEQKGQAYNNEIVANSDLIYKNTSKLDRILARSFFYLWVFSIFSWVLFFIFSSLGLTSPDSLTK